jgi:recombination protein RecA
MSVTIVGDVPQVSRLITGLHSFDRAFINRNGDIGVPIGKGWEIYGPTFCGKSTITYGIAGMLAQELETDIALADLEEFDPDFLTTVLESSGFGGSVYYIAKESDENTLDALLVELRKDGCGIGILDSIAAISPMAEKEGSIGEANMGRRAMIMAQFVRKALRLIRMRSDKTIFMVNHAYPVIGGRGTTTPGGEVKKYLASIRIQVKRRYYKNKYDEYPDGSYVIEGKVTKNRWGLKDKVFWLFVLSGSGINKNLTAVYDCIQLGLVERGKTIKIGDQSFGYLKNVVDKAHEGDEEFFSPFYELLANVEEAEEDEEINED